MDGVLSGVCLVKTRQIRVVDSANARAEPWHSSTQLPEFPRTATAKVSVCWPMRVPRRAA